MCASETKRKHENRKEFDNNDRMLFMGEKYEKIKMIGRLCIWMEEIFMEAYLYSC